MVLSEITDIDPLELDKELKGHVLFTLVVFVFG
jgi:hypothetical protein